MLAKFDELNVIEFDKGSASGGGSGAGAGGLSGGSLGIPLPDYDALTGLASQKLEKIKKEISKFIDKIKELWDKVSPILKKFEPLLKGIGSMFLTAFAWSWISKFLSKFKTLTAVGGLLGKIVGAVNLAIGAFSSATSVTGGFSAAILSLWASFKSYMSALTPLEKFKVGLVAMVGVFVTTYNAIKDFTMGTSDLGTVLLNLVPIITAAGAAMYAMYGPVGVVVTAIAAVTAGVIAYNNAQKELAEQEALKRMFDGQGQSMEAVKGYYDELNSSVTKYSDIITENADEISSNNKKFDESAVSIENLTSKLQSSFYTMQNSDIDSIIADFDNMAQALEENNNMMVTNILTTANELEALGIVSSDTTQRITDNAIKAQIEQGDAAAGLKAELRLLNEEYRKGNIGQQDYANKIKEITAEMSRLNSKVSEGESQYKSLINEYNSSKIDLKDPKQAQKFVEDLTETYNSSVEALQEQKKEINNTYDTLIARTSDPTLKQMLAADQQELVEGIETHLKQIEGDYKGTFLTIKTQMYESGSETADDMKEVTEKINENLGKIGDVELTGKGENMMNSYLQELIDTNSNKLPEVINMLDQNGYQIKETALKSIEFTDEEKNIFSNNIVDATQLSVADKNRIMTSILQNGAEFRDAQGKSIKFTQADKDDISYDKLTGVTYISASHKAKILSDLTEMGAEFRDAQGKALEFTQQEKEVISKFKREGAESLTKADEVHIESAMTKLGSSIPDYYIDGVYSKAAEVQSASKKTVDNAVTTMTTSFQAQAPTLNKAAQTLVTDNVNNPIKNSVNTNGAGTKAITQLNNEMWNGKRAITDTASSIGSSAGNSLSNSFKINNKTMKSSLSTALSNTISSLKKKNSGLFATLGFTIPSFNWFAEGGFPETGELFVAREAGPELVGNIGNKAAVANNDQIVAGIAQAAYQGVSNALKENKGKERQQVAVYIGNKKIYSGYGQYLNSESNMYGTSTVKV